MFSNLDGISNNNTSSKGNNQSITNKKQTKVTVVCCITQNYTMITKSAKVKNQYVIKLSFPDSPNKVLPGGKPCFLSFQLHI